MGRWGETGSDGAKLDFVVKALAPLQGFGQMGNRGVFFWVKGEDRVGQSLGPLQLWRLGGYEARLGRFLTPWPHQPQGTGFLPDVNLKVTQIPGFLSGDINGSAFCPSTQILLGSCDIPSLDHLEGVISPLSSRNTVRSRTSFNLS